MMKHMAWARCENKTIEPITLSEYCGAKGKIWRRDITG